MYAGAAQTVARASKRGTLRERLERRMSELRTERQKYEATWWSLGEQLAPYRMRKTAEDSQRGTRKDRQIVNSRPVVSVKTLSAGMMAGITSPARDWFKLTTTDPDLAELDSVKTYLDLCQQRIRAALQSSNFYRSLSSATYPDLCSIATSAMWLEEGDGGHVRFMPMKIGEFWLDVNAEGDVDTCFRERQYTTRQIVEKFGYEPCPQSIRLAWDNGNYQTQWTLRRAVLPNEEYSEGALFMPDGKPNPEGKRYASVWWTTADERPDGILHQSGYHEFPVLAPRWSASPDEAYGVGPGWDVLGDCRMLQHHERRKLEMIDKIVNPPVRGSESIKSASLLPGAFVRVPKGDGEDVAPILEISPQALAVMEAQIDRVEGRISEVMFAHLWNLLINDERNQRPTATEVEAKRQEVALMLGPLLENLNGELLEPTVERTYQILERTDMLPPAPEELGGLEMKVEFISIMHQMQQTTGLVSIRTLMQEVGVLRELHPDVIDKIDADAVVDELQRITGVRPDVVLSKDEVAKLRSARAAQESAEREGAALATGAQAVANLSKADVPKLSELAAAVGTPVAQAQAGALGPIQ
jgi:hypothetical protein